MKRKRMVFLPIFFLILTVTGFLIWAWRELQTPFTHSREGQYIEIARGSTPDEIINRLSDLGVIRHGWLLRLYVRLSDSGSRLKAGEYRFRHREYCLHDPHPGPKGRRCDFRRNQHPPQRQGHDGP